MEKAVHDDNRADKIKDVVPLRSYFRVMGFHNCLSLGL